MSPPRGRGLYSGACGPQEAIIAGVGNRAEIWSKAEWEKASTFDDINSIAAKMSEYGLSI